MPAPLSRSRIARPLGLNVGLELHYMINRISFVAVCGDEAVVVESVKSLRTLLCDFPGAGGQKLRASIGDLTYSDP